MSQNKMSIWDCNISTLLQSHNQTEWNKVEILQSHILVLFWLISWVFQDVSVFRNTFYFILWSCRLVVVFGQIYQISFASLFFLQSLLACYFLSKHPPSRIRSAVGQLASVIFGDFESVEKYCLHQLTFVCHFLLNCSCKWSDTSESCAYVLETGSPINFKSILQTNNRNYEFKWYRLWWVILWSNPCRCQVSEKLLSWM